MEGVNAVLYYNDKYYEEVVRTYGYTPCRDMTAPLPGFTISDMKQWFCGYNLGESQISRITKENTFVTLGLAVNREPHIGTVSQILRGIFFQKKGYKVQIVLGDIDCYSARASSIKLAEKNVKKYRRFIENLGFDSSVGTIRNQIDHTEIMKTAFLIAPKIEDSDFDDVKEYIYDYYGELGIYRGMSFPIKQSILLMFSDFIHEGFVGNYKNIIVLSGIDEHPYVPKADDIAARLNLDVMICGLFSPIIRGLNNQPKMSKSLAGSSITVSMTESKIVEIIMQTRDDKGLHDDSIVYQLMRATMFYRDEELQEIARHCDEQPNIWLQDKVDFAHKLFHMCDNWNK